MLMNDSKPFRRDTWSWALFSIFLGIQLGLLVVLWEKRSQWPWETLNRTLIGCAVFALTLPLSGALADLLRLRGPATALWGGLSWLWLVIHRFVPLSNVVFTVVFLGLLFHAAAAHKSLLMDFSFKTADRLSGRGLAFTLGMMALLLWIQKWIGLSSFTFGLFALSALVLLVFFTISVINDPPLLEKPDRRGLVRELSGYLKACIHGNDLGRLLLFTATLAAGGAVLLLRILSRLAAGPVTITLDYLPVILLIAAAWGGLTVHRFLLGMGFKRSLTLGLVVLTILSGAVNMAHAPLEFFVLALLTMFFGAITLAAGSRLLLHLTDPSRSAQTTAYFYLSLLMGVAATVPLLRIWPWQYYGVCGLLIFILSWCFLQSVNLARFAVSAENKGLRDLEWDWPSPPGDQRKTSLKRLSRHDLVSRAAQWLARFLAEIFFGNLKIIGREKLRLDGGVIFVSNHPNTFLDPLLITALAPGKLHYWAKSTLWNVPVLGGILDQLGAIPVYRRQDFEQDQNSGNRQAFEAAVKKLGQSAHILIFPEGVSQPGLSLKPIKTGAARLALQTMEAQGWEQDLTIVPLGLDYAEPPLFRTHVTVRVGEPVRLRDFRDMYEEDPHKAALCITEQLSEGLKHLLPHLNEPDLETLVHRVHRLYGERVLQILGQEDETSARLAISNAVNHYQDMDPDTVYLFNERMATYFQERRRLSTPENHPPIPVRDMWRILTSLFSFASFGLVANWVPYRLTGRFVGLFSVAPVWLATAKLGIGMLVFSVYYGLIGLMIYLRLGPLVAGLTVLAMAVSALIALGAMERFDFRFRQLKTLWQAFWTQDTNDDLEEMKVSLIQDLERFRENYAFFREKEQRRW